MKVECKHCTSLITLFFFLTAFYSVSLKVHTRTKCCSDTSKVMEFSKQKAFYTPNGMQRSIVNFQPMGPLSRAKGCESSRLFYGAWICLLTNPGQWVWLGKPQRHSWELCQMCVANPDVEAVSNMFDRHTD